MKNIPKFSNAITKDSFSLRWRIFISHTSELALPSGLSYVDKAINAVRTRRHIPIEMKDFPPQCESSDDYDAKQVKECDVYIGIFGMKYGTLTSKGISHTESEYQVAVKHDIPRLIFLINEKSRHLELTAEDLDPGKHAEKLKDFKKRVQDTSLVKYFDSPNELEKWINFGLEDLEKRIITSIPNAFKERNDSFYLTPIPFSLYLSERSTDFWGRQWLFDKVKNWATSNHKKDKSLLLTADYGVGKTAFMAQLVQNNSSGLPLAAMHFCQGRDEETLSPGRFVQSIAAQLQRVLPAYHEALQEINLQTLLERANVEPIPAWKYAVVDPLHEISKPDSRLLVVVDALDAALHHRPAPGDAEVNIVELLAEDEYFLPNWLRVLATSREIVDVTRHLQDRFEKYYFGDNDKNLQDLREYTSYRCQTTTLSAKLAQANLTSEEVVTYLCGSVEDNANFYFTVLLLDAIENDQIPLNSISDLRRLPPRLDNFYSRYFDAYFHKVSYTSVQAILGVLCEAREPLGLDELAAIMKQHKNEVSECLRPLDSLLTKRKNYVDLSGNSIDKRLSFSHFSVSQWLCDFDKSGKYCVNRDDSYKLISQWALSAVKTSSAHKWPYLVRHLSNYLDEQQRPFVMSNLLKCFDWIQARLDHIGSIPVLINDFEMYGNHQKDLMLMMLQRALGQSEQILRTYPVQLASQLLARLEYQIESEGFGAILLAAQQKAMNDEQVIPLTPSLFNPQLIRSNFFSIPFKREEDIKVTCLCSSEDYVFFGLNDGRVFAWSLSTGNLCCSDESEDRSHISPVTAIVLLPKNKQLASASGDKLIVWKLPDHNDTSLSFQRKLEGLKNKVFSLLAFPYRNSYFLISALDDHKDRLRVWKIDQDIDFFISYELSEALQNEGDIIYLTFLSKDKIVSISKNGFLRSWNVIQRNSQLLGTLNLMDFQTNTDTTIAHTNPETIITHAEDESILSLHVLHRSVSDDEYKTYVVEFDQWRSLSVNELNSWAPPNLHSFLWLAEGTIYYSLKDSAIISCRQTNLQEISALEMCYNDTPIHCLALSSNRSSFVTASIKKSVDVNYDVTVAIWDSAIPSTSLQQPHRSPVAWITTLDDEKIVYSFATDGSVCIWDITKPREPKTRFKLKDFKETGIDVDLRFGYFKLDDHKIAVRNGGGLHLYQIPLVPPYDLDSQPFFEYDLVKSDYSPHLVFYHDHHKLIFGCHDGQLIYKFNNSSGGPFTKPVPEKFTAVNIGIVNFMMQIDNDNLLCWSNEPSIEQVFVICNLKKSNNKLASTISYVIDAETIDKSVVLKRDDGVTFLRPLKVWEHDNCIAITHSDFMVTIWQWSYERQELKLISKLSGHTSIVCDIEQLANDNYVTISLDKTVRIWDHNNQLSGSCYCKSVFMGDYAFTSLYLCKFTNTVIVGDKMGNVHWFNVN
jgi:hypothetical protein